MARPVIHKRFVTNTEVHPKRGRPYMKTNYRQALCYKPWSMIVADDDTLTPYDEDVTCPACLEKLGGRRESNRDVIAASRRAEEYNQNAMFESWNK